MIIASTGDNQVAVESAEMGGAVFTRTLVKVLADLGSDRTGPIGLSEVFTRVSALMQSETQRMRIEQAPQMIDLWGSGDLILRDSAPPHSPSLAELTR